MTAPPTPTPTTAAATRTGRPRDSSRDRELIAATQDLLVEVGYDRLTIDAVASRVGAGKATVYRRWPNKTALVVDAVGALCSTQPLPATGTLRGDLLALAGEFVGSDRRRTEVIAGLLTAMTHDEQLRVAASEAIGRPRMTQFAEVIRAAIERGEAQDCDVALMSVIFPGLAFHRVAALGAPMDIAFVEKIIDTVLLPLLLRQPAPTTA
jgi:AcrR family transcriptional regulator